MGSYTLTVMEDGLLLFTITREEKRNAVNYEVMEGLQLAIKRAKEKDIKVLAITGQGERSFCSGGDLSIFHELRTEEAAYSMLSRMGNILYDLMVLEKPTVAVINGLALGGGCEIASACDFRIGKNGIEAGFIQGTLAITTGWGGGTILAEKLPQANALKMLTEAKRYKDRELINLTFLNAIYEGEPLSSLKDFLGQTLTLDVDVLKSYKQIWIQKWQATQIKERIDAEIRRCAYLWAQDAHHHQVEKFINLHKKE